MSENQKRGAVGQRKIRRAAQVVSALKHFDCEQVSYTFDLSIDLFNSKKFSRVTGIKAGEPWSAVLRPKDRMTGYHVHFNGRLESKRVHLTIEYFDGARGLAEEDESEPFAESIMQWLGSFILDPSVRAIAYARFRKPRETWRSRFNLPFKVTMADAEVVIDGVSLDLPRNQFRALGGFLFTTKSELDASVHLLRTFDLARFSIAEEVAYFNEAIKMFTEQMA